MTIQATDYMYIGKKKYSLIDIEVGKQITEYADFSVPEHDGEIRHLMYPVKEAVSASYHKCDQPACRTAF